MKLIKDSVKNEISIAKIYKKLFSTTPACKFPMKIKKFSLGKSFFFFLGGGGLGTGPKTLF
jgi:hypothetical protein